MKRVLGMDGDHGVTLGKHLVKCTVPLNCTLRSGGGGKLYNFIYFTAIKNLMKNVEVIVSDTNFR